MPVKRVAGNEPVVKEKKSKKSFRKAPKRTFKLPTEKKSIVESFAEYAVLLYGREKIGKTTLGEQFPGAIFAAFEPGIKGLEVYDFFGDNGVIPDWEAFRALVDLLVSQGIKDSDFSTVVVDTVDRAYDMCLACVCKEMRIPYPGIGADGKDDWGKSWGAIRKEFTHQFYRLGSAGFGALFISHAKDSVVESKSGQKYTRIVPTMSGQARAVVEALADFIFYAEYYNTPAGTNRVLVCQGDEIITAGARKGVSHSFPQFLPLLEEGCYAVIEAAFRGAYAGLDISELNTVNLTTKAGRNFLKGQSTKHALARRKKLIPRGERKAPKRKK